MNNLFTKRLANEAVADAFFYLDTHNACSNI